MLLLRISEAEADALTPDLVGALVSEARRHR